MDQSITEINLNEIIAQTYRPISMRESTLIDLGGRACTKSSKNAILIIMTMLQFKDCECVVIRQDAIHHRNSTLKELLIACDRLRLIHGVHYSYTYSPMNITLFNGSNIYFGALNDYEKLKGYKPTNASKYFGLLWFFEFTEFKQKYDMEQAISTFARGGNKDVFKIIMEANPHEDAYHWTYEFIASIENEPDYNVQFRTYLDLTEYERQNWLGEHILKQIDNMKRIDVDLYKHIYLGLPRVLENAIYKNKPKLVERPEHFQEILVGLDYGESDATTCVAVGYLDGKYYIFDQYYHNGRKQKKKTIIEYKTAIAEWLNAIYEVENCKITLYVETSPVTVYRLFGSDNEIRKEISIKKVDKTKSMRKSKDAIQERIDVTNIAINTEQLFICDETLPINKAFSQAVYKNRKRLDDGTSDIDSLDAFEYAIKSDLKLILRKAGVDYEG